MSEHSTTRLDVSPFNRLAQVLSSISQQMLLSMSNRCQSPLSRYKKMKLLARNPLKMLQLPLHLQTLSSASLKQLQIYSRLLSQSKILSRRMNSRLRASRNQTHFLVHQSQMEQVSLDNLQRQVVYLEMQQRLRHKAADFLDRHLQAQVVAYLATPSLRALVCLAHRAHLLVVAFLVTLERLQEPCSHLILRAVYLGLNPTCLHSLQLLKAAR